MEEPEVEKILNQHIQAVKDKNLERIAVDYSEDAVFITVTSSPDGTLDKSTINGREAIRNAFESVFTNILPTGSSMEFTNQIVEGEIAFITWSAKSDKYNIPSAADTFLIKDGKIIVQTGFTLLIQI